jgi:hypothetical protein
VRSLLLSAMIISVAGGDGGGPLADAVELPADDVPDSLGGGVDDDVAGEVHVPSMAQGRPGSDSL